AAAVFNKPVRLERTPDGAGLAAMPVHDDAWRNARAVEPLRDEIHLRLHRRQILSRAALQNKGASKFWKVGNLRDVEPDVLGQYIRQPGHDLVGLPTLPLKV